MLYNTSYRLNFIQQEKQSVQNIVYVMSEISTSLALFEEYNNIMGSNGRVIKNLPHVSAKVGRIENQDKPSLQESFNQKGIIIQFLLFSGLFELMNSLSIPDSVVKIIEFTCLNIKNNPQKPVSWLALRVELEKFYEEIIKGSDHLIIKANYTKNLRTLQLLKQVFKIFLDEKPPELKNGEMPKLLGEAIIKYLFAYTFVKRVGKVFGPLNSNLKFDDSQLSIERVSETISLFKKCNKKAFLIFLSKMRLNDQLAILDEVKDFLQV